jgi:hypothetical protein
MLAAHFWIALSASAMPSVSMAWSSSRGLRTEKKCGEHSGKNHHSDRRAEQCEESLDEDGAWARQTWQPGTATNNS